jgi:hypothetical protein
MKEYIKYIEKLCEGKKDLIANKIIKKKLEKLLSEKDLSIYLDLDFVSCACNKGCCLFAIVYYSDTSGYYDNTLLPFYEKYTIRINQCWEFSFEH